MARRAKNKSGLELVLEGDWKFSAFLAFLVSLLALFIIPSLNNPLIKALASAIRPLALIVIFTLLVIALFKYLSALTKSTNTLKVRSGFDSEFTEVFSPKISQEIKLAEETPKWSLGLLQDIEWKRFEELSTAYYLEKGIRAEATSLGADGGIDIKLYQDDSGKPTSLVQCKAWYSKQVGVKEIREFLGVLTHEKIPKGFYMISGSFSEDAKATAKANKINLISGEMFLQMIERLPQISQSKLLALATAGDYKTPSCSACGVKMVKRKSSTTDFWGCANFPRCRQRMTIRKATSQIY